MSFVSQLSAFRAARVVSCVLAAATVTLVPFEGASAQTYPNKPIRIISNYTPGGTTDFVARSLGQKLSEAVGQPVTVENRPSANGVVGTQEAIRSKPDGYTLLFSTSGHTSVSKALLTDRLPFDPFKDISPITLAVLITQILVVHPSLGVTNIPEFVKLMKANPGKYSYGSAGPGSPNHLGVELLKYMAGFDILHVPYKGGAPAVVDLVAGRTQLILNAMVAVLPMVKAGKVVPIGVGSARRSAAVPDVPTVAEQGYPDFEVYTWYGMFAQAGLPRDLTLKLNGIFNNALKQPDIVKGFTAQGAEPAGGTPEDLAKIMRSEYERWRKVVVAAKIEVDE
jgi:tripartite-type tricarboxylate transporter receptor subunit TctC